MWGADLYSAHLPMKARVVGGEPGHAEDSWSMWCADKSKLEGLLMTLESKNLQGYGPVGNQA